MQFLALTRRNADEFAPADFQAATPAEVRRVQELYMAGTVRQIWCREDSRGVALVIEAADAEAARAVLGTLPMHAKGMIAVETLAPLAPYFGFGGFPPAAR